MPGRPSLLPPRGEIGTWGQGGVGVYVYGDDASLVAGCHHHSRSSGSIRLERSKVQLIGKSVHAVDDA